MDNITQQGAPTKLISNRAQVEISKCVQEILRTLFIGAWQSKAYKQHQDFAECCYQDIKKMVNIVLDHSDAPAYCWLPLPTLDAPLYKPPLDGPTMSALYCGTISMRLSTTRMRQHHSLWQQRMQRILGWSK